MSRQGSPCPACGADATGRFCSTCGAALAPGTCAACGAAVAASARFCPGCGARAGGTRGGGRAMRAWAAAGAAVVALAVALVLIGRQEGQARSAVAAAAPSEAGAPGTPPDISQMSPRERFDRLYERSMRASESGDTATVERFAPMALLAYAQLDSIDADARYHAALLRLHTGDISGAAALGDSILAITPGHLFGYVVRATVGRWRHDEPATKAAYAGFLSHYDAEVRVARPEYAAHKMIMDDMHQRAQAAAKGL